MAHHGVMPDATSAPHPAAPLDRLDLLQQVLTALPVGVWILDESGRILYGNRAGQRIWAGARYVGIEGYAEYKGWWAKTGKPIRPEQWGATRAIRNGETSLDEEIEIECFDGARKVILHSATPIRDDAGCIAGAIVVIHDITERKRFEERLHEMAIRDALTGAYSRRYLYESLGEHIARARRYGTPLSLMMFDLDHFKRINDEHGHQAGDRVLAGVTKCVSEELRGVDVLARYGGEEFVIVAPGVTREQAALLAERLRARIAGARLDSLPGITCSFGVCEFDGGSADDLIRRADELMYRAKREGRNRVAAA
jgi:diguanylate cyclase (GGDEF)-like protein